MIRFLLTGLLLLGYLLTVLPLGNYLYNRPEVVKLGFLPRAEVLEPLSLDHELFVAQLAVLKVIFYYGELVEQWKNRVVLSPEYFNMFKNIETAIQLDPYNADAYYFAQSTFTWEIDRAADVNRLLEHGMQYRSWDPDLPFYAGFNYGFFLEDFEKAAFLMQRAAELSGQQFYANLAARYFYEADKSTLGLVFLERMIKHAKTDQERHFYRLRLKAMQRIKMLENALAAYRKLKGETLSGLEGLLEAGVLEEIPEDPYGGEFYIDSKGKVRTTSKMGLAFLRAERGQEPHNED